MTPNDFFALVIAIYSIHMFMIIAIFVGWFFIFVSHIRYHNLLNLVEYRYDLKSKSKR